MIDLYYWTTPNGHKITLFPGRNRPALRHPSDQHQPGRPVPGGFPEGVAEQQDSRHRRSPTGRRRRSCRCSSPAPSCSISRKRPDASRQGPARAPGNPAVAVLADGRAGADGRAEPPFQPLRPGEDSLRHRPVRQGKPRACTAFSTSAWRTALRRRRRLQHRRHGHLSVDRPGTSGRSRISPTSHTCSAGSRAFASVRRRNAPMLWWSASIRRSSGSRAGLRTSSRTIAGGACAALRSSLT